MKLFYKYARLMPVFILAVFLVSCGDDDDDDNLPEVVAGFTQTINQNTGTVTFINISENADRYLWDFGDSTSSTEINPVKTYENGEYTVVLTATNSSGADASFEDTFTILIPDAASLPITFDAENTIYEAETFNGTSFQVVANPDQSGTNDKAGNVGAITNSGAQFEGIAYTLGTPVNLTNGNSIEMNLWANAAVDVLLKLEITETNAIETSVSHGGSGWETLTFEFASAATYPKLVLFVDGPGTTEGTFYVDDIAQAGLVGSVPVITLEGEATINLNVGDTFNDPGASATDEEDDDATLTAAIVVGGDAVDTNTVGTYIITYNVTDSDGNAAAEVTRTVIVTESGNGACTGTLIAAQSVPVDFEGCETFLSDQNFGSGITSELAENPSKTGINTSDFVLKVDKPSGSDFFAGIQNVFASNFDLTTTNVFKVKVYSTKANVDFRFELAADPNDGIGNPAPVFRTVTNADEWTELEFSFDPLPAGPTAYNKLVIKPDNDMADSPITADGTYYFDDVTLSAPVQGGCVGTPIAAQSIPVDFEDCETFLSSQNFGSGLTSELSDNPSKTGINTSDFVLKVDKPSGSDFFAGVQNVFASNFDLSTNNVFKVKVYSTKANVDFRFELAAEPNAGIGNPPPVFRTITNADEWTELEFSFDPLPAGPTAYNKFVIKPDNDMSDSPITADGTYYIDDITLSAPGGGGSCTDTALGLPIDFDCSTIDYATKIVGNVSFTVVDNPEQSGINNEVTKVGQITNTGQAWENAFFNLDNAIDFTTDKSVKLKLYSTQALPIKLKFEDAIGSPAEVEADANHGGTGWEELTFTLASSASYNDMVIFVDGPGTAAGTFYVDDIEQFTAGGGGGGDGCSLPVDFEGCEAFLDTFGDGPSIVTAEIVANPDPAGINTSSNVLKVEKTAGTISFSGVQNEFAPGAFGDLTSRAFKVKIYSSLPNITFRFEAALVPQTDPPTGNPAPVLVTVPNANEWTEVTVQFINLPAPSAYNQFVIKPDNPGGRGDLDPVPTTGTYYFDDIRIE